MPIKPSKTSKVVRSYPGTPLTMYVDGGMAEDIGVIGFVVFSPRGDEVVRVGKCNMGFTNNQVELTAI
jgi:ribonuclease HI